MQGAHLVARSSYDLLTKDTPSQRLPLVMRSTWSARTSPSPVACCFACSFARLNRRPSQVKSDPDKPFPKIGIGLAAWSADSSMLVRAAPGVSAHSTLSSASGPF